MKLNSEEIKLFLFGVMVPLAENFYTQRMRTEVLSLELNIYDGPDPINLGTNHEISICNLVKLVFELMEFKGNIVWQIDKPNGQPRRCLDTGRAQEEFGFKARVKFRQGLKNTIDWYRNNYCKT